jgi:hypothetical protein
MRSTGYSFRPDIQTRSLGLLTEFLRSLAWSAGWDRPRGSGRETTKRYKGGERLARPCSQREQALCECSESARPLNHQPSARGEGPDLPPKAACIITWPSLPDSSTGVASANRRAHRRARALRSERLGDYAHVLRLALPIRSSVLPL